MNQTSETIHQEVEATLAKQNVHNFVLVAVADNGDVFQVTQIDEDFAMKVAVTDAVEEISQQLAPTDETKPKAV